MVNSEWVIMHLKSVNDRIGGVKGRIKNGSGQGTAPDQLVRIAFSFDTGKQEAGDKRHIDPFFTGFCIGREIEGQCTGYISFCRGSFQGFKTRGHCLFVKTQLIPAVG
jgi:hypothetical protein